MTASTVTQHEEHPDTPGGDSSKRPIEVGFVLAGALDAIDREAVDEVRVRVEEELRQLLPEFDWRLVLVRREETATERREEPVTFFHQGQSERDIHRWDFVLVITSADLVSHYKPFALAAVSRALDLAVLSTARIDPKAVDAKVERETRVEIVVRRMRVMILHCLGHLNGLEHDDRKNNLMWDADEISDLDRMETLHEMQIDEMRSNLRAIADLRIEEREDTPKTSQARFLWRAAWLNWREILEGVRQAEPWQFPVRLSRLSAAAFSAMLVLLMTEETWDMATTQSAGSVLALVALVLIVTTGYVVVRQQLLVRREDRLITEQIAVSNITATLIVLVGMITTLLVLVAVSLSVSLLLFPPSVVEGWATSLDGPIVLQHYLLLCGVVSSLSISIGALGASFEEQSYFRHVTFVDEEL